jgi:hypothetical protein
MQILYVVNDLPFADVITMKKEVDINDIALLGLCDRLGRFGTDQKQEKDNVDTFLMKCKDYNSTVLKPLP